MIAIDNTVISSDIAEQLFVCDIEACKGACCEEGDLGAPLEEDELGILEDIYDKVAPFLTEEGRAAIAEQGHWVTDWEGDFSTPLIEGKQCAYAITGEHGAWACGIEKAYYAGAVEWKKPISCHLYPIRITKYESFEALNYHRWKICDPACALGSKLGVPVYKFLKEPLERKYGKEWYAKLADAIEHTKDL
ncbi:MAG: DUF3109 family protein [Bacteroidota bacterium]